MKKSTRFIKRYYVVIKASLLISAFALVGNTANAETTPEPTPALPPITKVSISEIRNVRTNKAEAGIDNRIEIDVDNLKNLVQYAKCRSLDDKLVTPCAPQGIALFLNGREIKSVEPEITALDDTKGRLQFALTRSKNADPAKNNDGVWADLLGNPLDFPRIVPVGIGFRDSYPLANKEGFHLIRARGWGWFAGGIGLIVVVFVLLVWLARNTELLRDIGPMPYDSWTEGKTQAPKNARFMKMLKVYTRHKPYSLARVQMAFWFFLVFTSFLFIWLINGASDTITAATLTLIGIGAGTALGAAVVDAGKKEEESPELVAKKAEEVTLKTEIDNLQKELDEEKNNGDKADTAKVEKLTVEITEKGDLLTKVRDAIIKLKPPVPPNESQNFLMDILTDESNGITFHRFQLLVWTLVLGVLFVYAVWSRLSMPEFDATLLALMGISSGTYLGFKIPEKQ